MAWLSGYTYRMDIPVANPGSSGNRVLTIPFPGMFLRAHPSGAKIAKSDYSDVHVTKSDGSTELPVSLNAAKTQLTIDFASMPQGRTTLYVYYGNASASAPTAPSISVVAGTTDVYQAIDANGETTSEGGLPTDYIWGANLDVTAIDSSNADTYLGASSSWAIGVGTGSTKKRLLVKPLEALIRKGTTSAAKLHLYATSGGLARNVTLRTHRFKDYGTDDANGTNRHEKWVGTGWTCQDAGAPTWNSRFINYNRDASGATKTAWQTAGALGSNEIDTTEYVDSSALSSGFTSGWKAISLTASWIDDWMGDKYASGLLVKDSTETSASYADAFGRTSSDSMGSDWTALQGTLTGWGCNGTQGTRSAAGGSRHSVYASGAGSFTDALTEVKIIQEHGTCGIIARRTGSSYYLLYCSSFGFGSTNTLSIFYFDGTTYTSLGSASIVISANDVLGLNCSGTTLTAYKNGVATALTATHSALTSGESGLFQDSGATTTFTFDDFSVTASAPVTITAPSQTNSPVLEITYSALDGDQLAGRKLTTDTFSASTFSTQNRYCQIPSENGFAVMAQVNAELKADVFYVEPGGRIGRACKNTYPSATSYLSAVSPGFGLHYDSSTGRYWIGGNTNTGNYMALGYSRPYVPDSFTWVTNTSINTVKASFFPKNDVVYIVHGAYTDTITDQGLWSRTYTRSSNTWSSATRILTVDPQGTTRTLGTTINSGDAMTGSGTITLSGSAADYPSFGSVVIGTEFFWYTGKSGSTLTGVTRAMYGSTAALHSSGATVTMDRSAPTYIAMSYDSVNDRMAISYQIVSLSGSIGYGSLLAYNVAVALHYSFTRSRWEDAANNAITLPMDQRTEPVVSRANGPTYNEGLTATSDGAILAAFGEAATPLQTSTGTSGLAFWSEGRAARLAGGSWTALDAPDLLELKHTDNGSGRVILSGVGVNVASDGTHKVYRSDSQDYGVTIIQTGEIGSHRFAAPSSNTNWKNNVLWCSGASENGNLQGKGIVYTQHFAYHGALFLNAIAFTIDPVTRGGATAAGRATIPDNDTAIRGSATAAARNAPDLTVETATRGAATAYGRTASDALGGVTDTATRGYATARGRSAPDRTGSTPTSIGTPTSVSSAQAGNSVVASAQAGNSTVVPADTQPVG